MTGGPVHDARTLLAAWTGDGGEDGAYFDGMLLAAERAGLIGADESRAWRSPPPAAPAAPRAEPHLETLLAALRPLTRDEDAEAQRAQRRFDAALTALAGAGLLSEADGVAWRTRALTATAPWLDREGAAELAAADGVYALLPPPRDAAEAEADARQEREQAVIGRSGALRDVLVAAHPQRHGGTAVAAALIRTESVELVFHHVGEMGAGFEAFHGAMGGLIAPALRDAAATAYAAAVPEPVSAHGSGGLPHQGPLVITGAWRYHPAPPPGTHRLEAVGPAGARWTLG